MNAVEPEKVEWEGPIEPTLHETCSIQDLMTEI